jgi:hypothetical protein
VDAPESRGPQTAHPDRAQVTGRRGRRDWQNGAGDPLIISAAHFNLRISEPDIAQALLDAGTDPNARDRDGLTPLMWAAAMGPPDLVALLLRRGADANATTPEGITAWQLAVGDDVIQILRQARGVHREKLGGLRECCPLRPFRRSPTVVAPTGRDLLAEFKYAISLRAEWVRL